MRLLAFLPALFVALFGHAQPDRDTIPHTALGEVLHNSDSLRALSFEAGPMKFVPFVAPSYTPEMQFLITAGGLITFSFDRKDRKLLRSSIPFSYGKSTNGSTQLSVKANLYLRDDKWRITGEIWSKDMPDNYYGVGYDKARATPKSDSTSLYHRNWKRIYAKVMHQYKPKFFVGGIYDGTNTEATELNPVMAADEDIVKYGTNTRNRGLGAVFEYDSRDVPVNAYTGLFLDASVINYGGLGGHHRVLGDRPGLPAVPARGAPPHRGVAGAQPQLPGQCALDRGIADRHAVGPARLHLGPVPRRTDGLHHG